jgi:hypothetical protein
MMTLESLRKLTSGINHLRQYQYKHLPSPTAFRVLELLPGKQNEELCYRLHVVDWTDPPNFEAISYAWGDPDLQVSSICDGKELRITPNLRDGLLQFRYADQSRMLWADAVW